MGLVESVRALAARIGEEVKRLRKEAAVSLEAGPSGIGLVSRDGDTLSSIELASEGDGDIVTGVRLDGGKVLVEKGDLPGIVTWHSEDGDGYAVEIDVPVDAKFTDTVTTSTVVGDGNAVTGVECSGGALTFTKGGTYATQESFDALLERISQLEAEVSALKGAS